MCECGLAGDGEGGPSAVGGASSSDMSPSFNFCLLTFRNSEMEERFRASRLLRRTSSSLGISLLFLIVLASLWPVLGKVLLQLGATHAIYFSFTLGCGALVACWLLHACVVGFRKRLRLSDKVVTQLTLFLIALVRLPASLHAPAPAASAAAAAWSCCIVISYWHEPLGGRVAVGCCFFVRV